MAASRNIVLLDTLSPLSGASNLENRTGWKAVPGDLLTLEADPPKASSDPGYYGREYSFKGDAVVENRHLSAIFRSEKGCVEIYSKTDSTLPPGHLQANRQPSAKIVELAPLPAKNQPMAIIRLQILRNTGDEVALEVFFSAKATQEISAIFVLGKTEIVEIQPSANMKGISVRGSIQYGVVPSFVGDDLIFGPAQYQSVNTLCLPSENLFVGLFNGEDNELVMTWPKGKQQIQLQSGGETSGKRLIQRIDFENDGQSLYLAAVGAPGIWHKEVLTPSYLEKDVMIKWKKPFPAKWKTQLDEEGAKTTFAFKESKGTIWRGVPGSYSYPVWFNDEAALYHLSKKVPPRGESLIYFLEGQDTPPWISTPVDILKATLGRPMSEPILDLPGRKLRTHHRRAGDGVRRACTCGCTEAIQAVFEAGEEMAKKKDIQEDLDDMIYFVHQHVERIQQYTHFADEMVQFLRQQASVSPEFKPFLDSLEEITRQIPQEYNVQKENMKSFGYADDLAQQTMALCSKKDANNVKAYMELLKAWRAMGGAQDYVLAQCHTITRKLCQEAGYGGVTAPQAAILAAEIRTRCRQCLRNPDGYEIWADY